MLCFRAEWHYVGGGGSVACPLARLTIAGITCLIEAQQVTSDVAKNRKANRATNNDNADSDEKDDEEKGDEDEPTQNRQSGRGKRDKSC